MNHLEPGVEWVLQSQVPPELLPLGDALRRRGTSAIREALAHHFDQFAKFGKPIHPLRVAELLAKGEFAARPFQECNLWHDVILAAGLAERLPAAVSLFTRRFGNDVIAWGARYARGDAEAAADFLGDLILPREKSGPRIESYRGHAPLRAWLKQVFMTQADRRRKERGLGVIQELPESDGGRDAMDREDERVVDPGEAYAEKDCRRRLMPMLKDVFATLSPEEHTVVMMSVVDEVPQIRIAQLLGVRDFKVTRIKQGAFKRLREKFLEAAESVQKIGEDVVRNCVELILRRFATQ